MLRFMASALLAIVLLALGAGQAGMLRGTPPVDLGVNEGRLKAPSTTPNSVSSQAALWPGHPQASYADIAPLAKALGDAGDGAATLAQLISLVEATPGGRVVTSRPGYLRAEFTTRWLRFTDDAEFWFDPAAGVVHVRSASRLGREDLGVNRQRVEQLRARLNPG
jgi:uncharacterized protein (DUF1499 family)